MNMVRSRVVQVVYRSIYVTLLGIGIVASLGLFSGKFNTDFYAYYTNLSNYLCFGIMIAELVFTIKALNRKEFEGNDSPLNRFKFLAAVWILITCAVYNILLGDITSASYWTSLSNLTLHLVCPIMFIVDYFLFSEKKKLRKIDTLWVLTFPYIYIVFIVIRALIIGDNPNAMIYPYFFLDVTKYGYGGVALWVLGLSAVFMLLAFLFYFYNTYQKKAVEESAG